jgi:DNA invertase Pin-like site-specific DNA recombinase
MTYGYARVSTPTQNIERQVRNITEGYPGAKIIREVHTGTDYYGRKEFQKLIKKVIPGDRIIFDSVSRMSRDAEEGFKAYQELYDRNVELIFLKEPHINTATYKEALSNTIAATGNEIADEYIKATNRVLMILARRQISLAFEQAEKEVLDLRQRTREGMITAKMEGQQIGQKKGIKLKVKKAAEAKKLIQIYSKDFLGNMSDVPLIKLCQCCRNSYYKYKKELRESESNF